MGPARGLECEGSRGSDEANVLTNGPFRLSLSSLPLFRRFFPFVIFMFCFLFSPSLVVPLPVLPLLLLLVFGASYQILRAQCNEIGEAFTCAA